MKKTLFLLLIGILVSGCSTNHKVIKWWVIDVNKDIPIGTVITLEQSRLKIGLREDGIIIWKNK